ncbi:uncharacterized protein BDV14DRAFT_195921 [Aspergillus stella-maris]|uniref:uncharacterized protein n=1 Tax=Aspergillus stella-maris TaxID=1810926 RepID=UPI003CCE480A
MAGKLPPNLPWDDIPESPVQHIENVEPKDYYPQRMCRSPIEMPHMSAPIKVAGTELGLPQVNKDTPLRMSPQVGDSPNKNLPKIYLGESSPRPRWLIRPVSEQNTSSTSRLINSSQLPRLGQLRWEFDAGLPATHGQNETQLRKYAYRYLQNSLNDPVIREQLREMIWNSQYSRTVAHIEDPLPIPPPPPHFKDQKPADYANLRPPVSASAPDDYTFMYPGYERPSLAARSYKNTQTQYPRKSTMEQLHSFNFGAPKHTASINQHINQPMNFDESCSSSRSNSTASSSGTTLKEFEPEYHRELHNDEGHHHLRPEAQTKPQPSGQSPGDPSKGSNLSKLPKQAKGRPKRKRDPTPYIAVRTLDEIAAADAAPPRKRRGAVGRNALDPTYRDPKRLSSAAYSADEEIKLPRIPRLARTAGPWTRSQARSQAESQSSGSTAGVGIGKKKGRGGKRV